ncbi:MAG: NAD(P)/FAD-dependent oxidoreductase [Oligoflexia bacterium]|nr:NAD(P)/FAD-dependent oxidoreductase [Oligoflexia bacterium]MBF0366560.1 NAD(P)/FAD-dependent oxidoreductase [Oligoflexia bacterium]
MKRKKTVNFPSYDVVVIGGGIIGTFILYELSHLPLKILLLEKEEDLAFGVSKANSGIIHAGFHEDPKTLKGHYCAKGNALYSKISKKLQLPFKRVGELLVIKEEREYSALHEFMKKGEQNKVTGLKIIDGIELHRLEPHLSEQLVGALYAPSAGVINPYELIYTLARFARCNGATLLRGEEVIAITKDNSFHIYTSKGRYHSKVVINAAGMNGDTIAAMMGVATPAIEGRKGQEYLLDKKHKGLVKHIIFPLPTPESKGTLIIPTLDGPIMLGPTAENMQAKDREDLSTDQCGYQEIMERVKFMLPAINERAIIAGFSGMRPIPREHHDFIIGNTSVAGFFQAIGMHSPGLTAAPAIAMDVAKMVSNYLSESKLIQKQKRCSKDYQQKEHHCLCHTPKKLREVKKFSELQKLWKSDPEYGEVVCRCEEVSLAEIRAAIRDGATTLDGVKFRTRMGMGRCQGAFCTYRAIEVMASELAVPHHKISKKGKKSTIIVATLGKDHE